jgi:putative ABC transport system permease protein
LLQGRLFDERDQRNSAPVMIISKTFARRFFPDENPLGRKIELGAGEVPERKQYDVREIVGVVGDIRTSNLAETPRPAYYIPIAQMMWGPPAIIVRTSVDPEALVPALQETLESLDPEAPLHDVRTMEYCVALDLGRARFESALLVIFAGMALLLTAIGLSGAITYSVSQRTHEIGVRIALGASQPRVVSMVLNRAVQLTSFGIIVGVAGALLLTRVMLRFLYNTAPRDLPTYSVVCITVILVALLASYLPALRASRIDPIVALRQE